MVHRLWQLTGVCMAGRLKDVDLRITPGVTAVLGASGAGKSSLLNLLVGFETANAGDVARSLPDGINWFWVPQDYGLWSHLTVEEHLTLVQPVIDRGRIDDLLRTFDLASHATARPGTLSVGQQARLSVARALASEADLLVMDEPLNNVDERRLHHYWEVIAAYIGKERSLVFSTHQLRAVHRLADQVIFLDDGRCIYAGTLRQLYHEPANRREAEILGPVNWFEGDEVPRWLPSLSPTCDGAGRAVRPADLDVFHDESGNWEVVRSQFLGDVATLTVTARGRETTRGNGDQSHSARQESNRTLWCPAGAADFRPTDRVSIRLRPGLVGSSR